MREHEISAATPAELRIREAEYLFHRYMESSSGDPVDSYFRMICYFDAFLFVLYSLVDLEDAARKTLLSGEPIFQFFTVLRNATVHHSVLAAPLRDARFGGPLDGHNPNGGTESSRLRVDLDRLMEAFRYLEEAYPTAKRKIDAARSYVAARQQLGTPVFLEDVMAECMQEVRKSLQKAS